MTVSSVSPTAVPAGAVSTITVHGSGFETGTSPDIAAVTVGTYDVAPADITVTSASTLTVRLPAAGVEAGQGNGGVGAGTFAITVTLTGGVTSAPNNAGRLIVFADPTGTGRAVPVLDGLSPTGGNEAGGTKVTIYGSGFSGSPPTVTFGGVAGTGVHVLSDNELTVLTPAYRSSGPATTCLAGDDPATGVCQSQVQVVNANG